MGRGSYTAHDWTKLKTSRKLDSGSVNEIFSKSSMNPKYDPKYIDKREARDSEEHPETTPIIIGVDVTGSMGYLSEQIIKKSLNDLMQQLYSTDMIKDPQIMFAALGDAVSDSAPLQVTQFESDIRIAEQLLGLWLENNGGDIPEDYELLWYFAANHTDTDCFRKRGRKGFCISIGDAPCHEKLMSKDIRRIFGKDSAEDITSRELAEKALEKYELFHIMIGNDTANFHTIIPGRTLIISKSDTAYLAEIIISVIQISCGKAKNEVSKQWGELARCAVERALSLLTIENQNEISF